MIVWGGTFVDGDWTEFDDGAAFDPSAGTWRALPSAPISGRSGHSGIWTGSEMIVWGGTIDNGFGETTADGAAYDPLTNSWRLLAPSGVPARTSHTAAWTGSEMIVVGGVRSSGRLSDESLDGVAYDPVADTWRVIARGPWESETVDSAVAWDGHDVLVWGGFDTGADAAQSPWLDAGFSYDPVADRWEPLAAGPLTARSRFMWAWTGRELIIAGGQDDTGNRADAAAYDPVVGRWRSVAELPEAWALASSVWTGDEVIVVGGCCVESTNVMSYDPVADEWSALADLSPLGCNPGECTRFLTQPVWTGTAAIIWGGQEEVYSGGELDSAFRSNGGMLDLDE
jgi:hypothetical protein